VHPAVVCVKWAVQRGQTPNTLLDRRNEYESNLEAVVTDPLTEDEMQAIAGTDKNDRLIKGARLLVEARSGRGRPVGHQTV